ncbi:MAG: methionyl-tRNA formyltransferase, partial [Sphingomonadaceae bacterium]|nr:methionyl-tRNA formyltransferase [Sphingomonadaceae bacterium]
VAAYTQPPRPAHRGKALTPSPVDRCAEALGIPVATPRSLKSDEEKAAFAALAPDVAVVAAYGLILGQAILDTPRLGCLNVHASLLPRWRGAAPIQRAILAGDAKTGVTIMAMARGLDTGPMIARAVTPINGKTAGELTEELAAIGARLVVETLADRGSWRAEEQDDAQATYAAKIDKAEARLDFARPAIEVERAVRAFNPAPGAFFEHDGERIRVLAAKVVDAQGAPGDVRDDRLTIACGEAAIRPALLQRAGRGAMTAEALLRGFPIPPGTRLA